MRPENMRKKVSAALSNAIKRRVVWRHSRAALPCVVSLCISIGPREPKTRTDSLSPSAVFKIEAPF